MTLLLSVYGMTLVGRGPILLAADFREP